MNLLLWIVFGGIVGAVASYIMKSRTGILMDIVLGVLGAVVGGLVMNLFGSTGVTGFNLYSFIVALLGAVVLIWVGRRFV